MATVSTVESPARGAAGEDLRLPRPDIDLELENPAFSGPLSLLLELIEKRRLPIAEISLAQVTDQYLERMRTLVGLDPDVLADFLVIAARLLLIKSRDLLPSRPREVDEPDVAAELAMQLMEYKLFREAAEQLRQMDEAGLRSYPRQLSLEPVPAPEAPLAPIPAESLRSAMARMLKAVRGNAETTVGPGRVSVQERMEFLLGRLASAGGCSFSEVAGETVEELVATFLALLELLHRGVLEAEQESVFGDIRLSLRFQEEQHA